MMAFRQRLSHQPLRGLCREEARFRPRLRDRKPAETLDYLIDGAVISFGFCHQTAMGYTDKFPAAVAYKFAAEENVTTLLDVTWELGRTGKLTPLAHLAPTDIGGVTVQRATLNNYGDILRKKVAVGCEVDSPQQRRDPESWAALGAHPGGKAHCAAGSPPSCGEPVTGGARICSA